MDIADIHPVQPHRGALPQSAGVVKVRSENDFRGEKSAGIAHQEHENRQSDAGSQHRKPDLQLGPLQLLLARHVLPEQRRHQGPSVVGADRDDP